MNICNVCGTRQPNHLADCRKVAAYEGLIGWLWPPHPMTGVEWAEWVRPRIAATGITAQQAKDALAAVGTALRGDA
jgi:hypothetical protein